MCNDGVRWESALVGLERSPDGRLGPAAAGFVLRERPCRALLTLRGTGQAFFEAAAGVLGLQLPARAGQTAAAGGRRALWMGPDEWLLCDADADPSGLEASLRGALAAGGGTVVDVSSGLVIVTLQGSAARAVLAAGCPLDLHPRVFVEEQCAQSHYFKAPVTLWRGADDTFSVVVRRSFAHYAVDMLLDAAQPYLGGEHVR